MQAVAFIIVGAAGMLLLVFLGNRLLHRPDISSKQFACSLAGLFAVLLFMLILISRHIDMTLIIFAFILASINFGVGYPILYFVHHYYKSNRNR